MKKIDDIGFCYLTSSDVVRHPLVQKIVQAYDAYEKRTAPRDRERAQRMPADVLRDKAPRLRRANVRLKKSQKW